MKLDQILALWSTHNTLIIEVLVAIILILAIFVAYFLLFGSETSSSHHHTAATSSDLIEKTLEKILENQKKHTPVSDDLNAHYPISSDPNSAPPELVAAIQKQVEEKIKQSSAQEIQKIQSELETKKKEMENLQVQLSQKPKADDSSVDSTELSTKLKDLEARLSEYEIISEEIADLSKYKAENKKLRDQLSAKSGTGAGAAPAPTEVPPAPTPTPPASAPTQNSAASVIDDDLMKEFAAAVDGQKAASAAKTSTQVEKPNDTEQLMDEFQNFTKKT